ncbi:SLAM family member 9-like isoform X2 [Notamacropus eugenii]|uniref:SLAM family member 9-like isoform X2 n=1 Tax=Notamacropus eugenii TaxID=9315 RepID=UPI003B67D83F
MTHLLQWLPVFFYLQIEEATSTDNEVPLTVIGTVGKSAILPVKIPSDDILTIAWLSSSVLATVAVEENSRIIITDPNYHNRLEIFSKSDYSLQINNLTTKDENCYKGQVTIKSRGPAKVRIQQYHLYVYEELSKPEVTANFIEFENGTCKVVMLCSVENEGKNVSYKWISLKDREEVTDHEGPNITVSWRPGESEQNYMCRVTNPVSSQRSEPISSSGLCTGTSSRNYVKLVIGIVIAVALCVAIMIGSIFWKKKRQGFLQYSPNHVQQQEATTEGTTVYAQVNHPNKEEIKSPNIPDQKDTLTIYSTIQSPKEKKEATLPEPSTYSQFI